MKNVKSIAFLCTMLIFGFAAFGKGEQKPKKLDMGARDSPKKIKEFSRGINKSDEYSSTWEGRFSWNLANVHDPSVAYWSGDGYYYMYQTDASFGNVHDGHGHYLCRRSKDLVNWSYVGMALPQNGAKHWILQKLNEFRVQMNLAPFEGIEKIMWAYWAPTVKQVTKSDGQTVMRMYYDVVVDNYIYSGAPNRAENFDNSWTERAFIGMAECSDPAKNDWVDKGYVLCSSSAKGVEFPSVQDAKASKSAPYYRSSLGDWDAYFFFNAIDPTYFIGADGKDYLIYGSWHRGFAGLEIDRDSGLPVGFFTKNEDGTFSNNVGLPWAQSEEELAQKGFGKRLYCRGSKNAANWQPSEGPEVIFNPKDQKYYLFFANDGLDIPYHTRVVRSENPLEGYVDMCGNVALQEKNHEYFPIVTHPYKFKDGHGCVGFSHCTVFEKDGEWFYCSQGRLPPNVGVLNPPYSNAFMMGHVRKILWCPNGANTNDLWPVSSPERYANIAQKNDPITKDDIIGTWEHINLVYKYAQMNQSDYVKFNKDKTVVGAFSGFWEFDEQNKQLLITFGEKKPVSTLADQSVIFVLEREWDWEKKCATIVYAALSSGIENTRPVTFWGKKVQ